MIDGPTQNLERCGLCGAVRRESEMAYSVGGYSCRECSRTGGYL